MVEVLVGGQRTFAHTGGVDPDATHGLLLLVHGAANDHSVWRYQTRRLAAQGRPAFAVDLPGHGKSEGPPLESIQEMAQWCFSFVEAVGMPPVTVIGHSMGSLIALEMAAARPLDVRGIVLFSPSDRMRVHPDLLAAARARDERAIDLIVGWTHTGTSRFGHHPEPGSWKTAGTRRLNEHHLASLAVDLIACEEWEGSETIPRVAVPALVVVGEHDRMTPAAAGRSLFGALPAADFVEVAGGSHASIYDHPGPINAALDAWLARLDLE
jgi:pimeloyl-ACP methyl ester carboxylesterase